MRQIKKTRGGNVRRGKAEDWKVNRRDGEWEKRRREREEEKEDETRRNGER